MASKSKAVTSANPGKSRKMRADGRRNRQRLIQAAKQTFTEEGPEASLEAIARRAGVGIGTLYRNFANRAALIEAVCRDEVEELAAAAQLLLEENEPGEALHKWMRLYVGFIATNKLLASAVNAAFGDPSAQHRSSVAQITDNPILGASTDVYRRAITLFIDAAALLLERARAAGHIRGGIDARDLMRALGGFTATYGDDVEGWEESALRLVDVLMSGLSAKGSE
jgi:AcrR family transcriptional regulator